MLSVLPIALSSVLPRMRVPSRPRSQFGWRTYDVLINASATANLRLRPDCVHVRLELATTSPPPYLYRVMKLTTHTVPCYCYWQATCSISRWEIGKPGGPLQASSGSVAEKVNMAARARFWSWFHAPYTEYDANTTTPCPLAVHA